MIPNANRIIPITITNAIKDKKFDCSEGKQLRDFIFVDDVISAIIKIIKSKKSSGEIINIGSGKPLSVKNVINKICKLVKKGRPQFGKIKLRKDEILILYPDIKKAKKLLRWRPKTSIKNGLNKTISFFKKCY